MWPDDWCVRVRVREKQRWYIGGGNEQQMRHIVLKNTAMQSKTEEKHAFTLTNSVSVGHKEGCCKRNEELHCAQAGWGVWGEAPSPPQEEGPKLAARSARVFNVHR